ncbi:hypothetical protein [Scytonema millei]|uniref:Uncharacterized protein n=1 Tax=Scytonema millei VB511283 TaxID=1245923 RepID=A0A9X5E772_9CYAN|nr:hypothetical protein [Scytonema millei]NHC36566.1 hypothetical protein [Scytonema millei VB511283]
MSRRMCWLSQAQQGEKILHLQLSPDEPWKPYTAFRQFAVPDYPIPGGSKGWATYQKLLKAGWTLVHSSRAQEFTVKDASIVNNS